MAVSSYHGLERKYEVQLVLAESPSENLTQSCAILIMEIQPEFLAKMSFFIDKSHNKSYFRQY